MGCPVMASSVWLRNWAVMFPIGLNAGQMKRRVYRAFKVAVGQL
jgi:hypothetical protein